jgi:hypothetical protein
MYCGAITCSLRASDCLATTALPSFLSSNYVSIDSTTYSYPLLKANTNILGGYNTAGVNICLVCTSAVQGDVSYNDILIKLAVDCSIPISLTAAVTAVSGQSTYTGEYSVNSGN